MTRMNANKENAEAREILAWAKERAWRLRQQVARGLYCRACGRGLAENSRWHWCKDDKLNTADGLEMGLIVRGGAKP